jgi:RNA polymerase sigma factor (sigma-70 family)
MRTVADSLSEALGRLAGSRTDEDAWETIYRRTWPFVFAISYRMMREAVAAEDVAQETFLRVARYFPFERIVDEKVFRFYIATIAKNAARDARRKRPREIPLDELPEPEDSRHADEEAEVASTLDWLGRQLSPADYALFQQLIAGAPVALASVAQDGGISYSAAAVRLHRLRGRIRKLLGLRVKT